jgi:hypothetical protein
MDGWMDGWMCLWSTLCVLMRCVDPLGWLCTCSLFSPGTHRIQGAGMPLWDAAPPPGCVSWCSVALFVESPARGTGVVPKMCRANALGSNSWSMTTCSSCSTPSGVVCTKTLVIGTVMLHPPALFRIIGASRVIPSCPMKRTPECTGSLALGSAVLNKSLRVATRDEPPCCEVEARQMGLCRRQSER